MREFAIRGVRLGAGAPKTIVSLMGGNADELVAQARKAAQGGADLLEWRVDHLSDPSRAATVARGLRDVLPRVPLVATVRTVAQGGFAELSRDAYANLCRSLVRCACTSVLDIEFDKGERIVRELVGEAHAQGKHAIVSFHDFARTPSTPRMVELMERMVALGADLPKLAVMAKSQTDCLRLMEASARVRDNLGVPTVAIAMGPHGTLSRLAGESCGSALTFCSLDQASAPGQVELTQTRDILASLHAALGKQDTTR